MSTREYQHPHGGIIHREMARCVACMAWWSVPEESLDSRCPCGGTLKIVDFAAYVASVPRPTTK